MSRADMPPTAGDALTPRELDVLVAYAKHGNQAEAAHELGMAVHTMKNHVTAVYTKLDVQSAIEAFVAMGWLRIPDVEDTRAAERARDTVQRLERAKAELTATLEQALA